jgi:hypothetical protein
MSSKEENAVGGRNGVSGPWKSAVLFVFVVLTQCPNVDRLSAVRVVVVRGGGCNKRRRWQRGRIGI